ncbi:MAG: ribosome maturation factor RimM [Casimicrobiaceae bacterium]
MVVLGHVQGAYGVAGWVKVVPYTETDSGLLQYGTWWLRSPGGASWQARRRTAGRLQGDTVVAQIDGIVDREAALALKGSEVAVPRSALPPVEQGEMYWSDLVGLTVMNRQGQCLGRVRGVTAHAAHPLLQVVRDGAPEGAGGAERERLIPYVPPVIDAVDLAGRCIEVDWGEDF